MVREQLPTAEWASVYFQFVDERHQIWERRRSGAEAPWTEDPILLKAKFTNVYRCLDAGSQYAIELMSDAETFEDVLLRAWLYRFTNRPDPWQHFQAVVGRYPRTEDLRTGTIKRVWRDFRESGGPVFGSAYHIFADKGRDPGTTQLDWIVDLAKGPTDPEFVRELRCPGHTKDKIKALSSFRRVGPFMAMQILTDLGYSGWLPWYDEDRWVQPGPGAIVGAKVLGMRADEAIDWSWDVHWHRMNVVLDGLPPSKMDIQNTFCEFGKYARYRSGRGLPRGYRPAGTDHTTYTLPARWRR